MKQISRLVCKLSLVIICLIPISCQKKKNPNGVVLQIGELTISQRELFKDFDKYYTSLNESGVNKNKLIKKWIGHYIDDRYLLAEAIELKYDTLEEIKLNVEGMANWMLCCYKGCLWNKVEEPKLEFTEGQIRDAFEKSGKLYYLEIVVFNHLLNEAELAQLKAINKMEEFEGSKLIQKAEPMVGGYIHSTTFIYPSPDLWEIQDSIIELSEKDIKPIVSPYRNRTYIVYVKKMEKTNIGDIKQFKDRALYSLRMSKEQELLYKKQREIAGYSKQVIDTSLAKMLAGAYRINNDTIINTPKELILFSYYLENKKINVNLSEYTRYVKTQPIRFVQTTTSSVLQRISDYILMQHLQKEAADLGLTNDSDFLADKNIFKHNQTLNLYKVFLTKNLSVNETEVLDYYNTNKGLFLQKEFFSFEKLHFTDRNKAYEAYSLLTDSTKVDSKLQGVVNISNIKLRPSDTLFTNEIKYQLTNIPVGAYSKPIVQGTEIIIFHKQGEGKVMAIPYNFIRNEIHDILLDQKRSQLLTNRVSDLKKKYKLKLNLIERIIEHKYNIDLN